MMVAEILFPMALPGTLSYRISEKEGATLSVGTFVRAPVGNRTYLGIVHAIHASCDTSHLPNLKFITSVESHLIPVSPKRIELWNWISEYYMCCLGEVMKAATITGLPIRHTPASEKQVADCDLSHIALSTLSPQQSEAFQQIQECLVPSRVVLLQSVRKKTEIYHHLLKQALISGKSVLFLLPEIGVSEQFYQQLKSLFGARAYLFHSGLTSVQRRNMLQEMAQQTEPIIVTGLRSSLLLIDLEKFDLIIVDEEQDVSYKQTDPAPRFHARDLAVVAGHLYRIPILLGTSCASLESEYNIRTGKYLRIKIDESDIVTPHTEVIDTSRLYKKKQMEGMISHPLLQALTQNLTQQKQALLFCRRCALLQEQLQSLIPFARIARLDEDHTPAALRSLLQKFAQKEIDLLIGTQTIHKGLSFNNIGVVGILEADKQLSRHDFRAHERAYQIFIMLSHRMESPPLIFLQTAQADHAFFSHFTHGDNENFILEQLQERKEFGYPPFTRIIALRFKHRAPQISLEAAQQCANELTKTGITHISGPFSAYTPNAKLHTQLLWIHLPRHLDGNALKKRLYEKITTYSFPKGGVIQIDVDPY
ncbi:MAG: hypothetical protein FWD56_00330 [Bacteroidales bacterium]|nr:hypothetical protein [Bacteroidales bacterium]